MPIPSSARRALAGAALAVLSVAATGCMTGERPTLGTSPTAAGTDTGDANVDALLERFDRVESAVFTAQYTATVRFGGKQSTITVTQAAPDRTSVTINDVRFITEAAGVRTCTLASGQCSDGLAVQTVSDTGVTPDLVQGDVAKRLRRFAPTRIGATTSATVEVAGQTATCVDVPLSGGTATYCALEDGVLARLVDGDVTVEMTSYQPTADEALFSP